MIAVYRPWLNRAPALLIAVITLGFVRIDRPRIKRLPKVRSWRRWWMTAKAHRRGSRDGKLGIPRPDEDKAPPEVWKLKQQGDGIVRSIAATWVASDARLSGEHVAVERAIRSVDERVRRLRNEIKKLNTRHEKRRNELLGMKRSAEKTHADERWRIPTWFYVLALGVIFIGEFPLNAVAFNLFGENRWPTYAMTAGLAAVLVFCAHSLGILWRQQAMSDRDLMVTRLLFLLPVLVIAAIAYVREEYLQALNRAGGGLAVLTPAAGIIIFIVMNLIIYLAAFALSYLHHDPAGEMIDRVEREVRKGERKLRRRLRQIERAAALKQWLLTKLALWEAGQDEAHRNAAFQAKAHKDFFEAIMQEYWAANRRVTMRVFKRDAAKARRRGDAVPTDSDAWTPPKALDQPPEIAKKELDRLFSEDMLERIAAARDGSAPKRRSRRAPKKTGSSSETAPAENGSPRDIRVAR